MTLDYQLRPATMEDKEFLMHLERVNNENFPTVMKLFNEADQKHYYNTFFKPRNVRIIEYDNRPIGAQSQSTYRFH